MQETGTIKWTWEGSSVPESHHCHFTLPGHGANIRVYQAGGHSGAYCPLGRQIGGGQMSEVQMSKRAKFAEAGGEVQDRRLESMQ